MTLCGKLLYSSFFCLTKTANNPALVIDKEPLVQYWSNNPPQMSQNYIAYFRYLSSVAFVDLFFPFFSVQDAFFNVT